MPRGASPKREREYKKLERKFKKEKRYAGREEEVAARIVNKQRAQSGETKYRHKPPRRTTSRRKSRTRRRTTSPDTLRRARKPQCEIQFSHCRKSHCGAAYPPVHSAKSLSISWKT